MRTSRRAFLRQSGLAAGAMCLTPHDVAVGAAGGDARQTLNPWRLEPVDLRRFIRLGVEHIYQGAVNQRRECLPFLRFNLTSPPTWARHEYWSSPHMTGRFLDALALCADVVDVPHDEEVIDGLRKLLHDCLDNPMQLPFESLPDPQGRESADMSTCREVLLGLVGLWTWRECEQSKTLARSLVRAMDKATRDTGLYPAKTLYENGWGASEPGWINNTTGRSIGALTAYYRATKDELAIDLARRFADINIERTFTSEGKLTEASGTHLHSTEGTMASILDLGVLTQDQRYIEIGKRIYDVGLKPWRTSYGWAKEIRSLKMGRGEANNTGDFIEAALTLAFNGHPETFADAERFIRNALLASQVVATDWIPQSDETDTNDYAYSDIRKRARGAFVFTTPNGYDSYNTDLMGGSLRALCKAYHASVTGSPEDARINMCFSTDAPWGTVRSSLPEQGQIQIRTLQPQKLFVRLPEGISEKAITLRVAGKLRPAMCNRSELVIGDVPAESDTKISFNLPRRTTQESAPGYEKPFEIEWAANTIVAMQPAEGKIALY